MKPKFRIRLGPAVTARIIFFVVLYLVGLSVLPAVGRTHEEIALAWNQSSWNQSSASSLCCDSRTLLSPDHRVANN